MLIFTFSRDLIINNLNWFILGLLLLILFWYWFNILIILLSSIPSSYFFPINNSNNIHPKKYISPFLLNSNLLGPLHSGGIKEVYKIIFPNSLYPSLLDIPKSAILHSKFSLINILGLLKSLC